MSERAIKAGYVANVVQKQASRNHLGVSGCLFLTQGLVAKARSVKLRCLAAAAAAVL